MADDWDTVTKIGSKTGGGSSQRETVVKGKGALNKAARTGAIVATEKKFATGNSSNNKAPSEGQRLTKVDRSDDIVVPQKTGTEIGNAIRSRRSKDPYKMTQKELATAVNAPLADIKLLESGEGIKNQGLLNRVAKKLDISPRTGVPLPGKE